LSNEEAQDFRSLQLIEPGSFTGTDFNVLLGQYTSLEPIETGAVLDATNLEDVTECRTNNYSVETKKSATLWCKERDEKSCDENDFIIENRTDGVGSLNFERCLLKGTCSAKGQQECCGQSDFDRYCRKELNLLNRYCKQIGCNYKRCNI
jgi:hypothetical protein